MPDNGQPQPQPAVFPCGAAVGLTETVKDIRQKLSIDTGPGVADRDFKVRFDALKLHLYLSASGRELDGVGEQIPDDLLEPNRVAQRHPCSMCQPIIQLV